MIVKEFQNELDASIRIEISADGDVNRIAVVGPTSMSENFLTPDETSHLFQALREFEAPDGQCLSCGEAVSKYCLKCQKDWQS